MPIVEVLADAITGKNRGDWEAEGKGSVWDLPEGKIGKGQNYGWAKLSEVGESKKRNPEFGISRRLLKGRAFAKH